MCTAALLAACGGTPATRPTATTQFHVQATRLCNQANADLNALPLPPDADVGFDTMTPVLERSATIHRDLVERLRGLQPPAQERQAVTRWLDTASVAIGYLEHGNAAVRAGDYDGSKGPYDQAGRIGTDALHQGDALGLHHCFLAVAAM